MVFFKPRFSLAMRWALNTGEALGVFAWPVTSHHPPRPQAVEYVSHEEFGGRLGSGWKWEQS